MASNPSTEDSREVSDERVVRTFLENAAPIILESRTLDDQRFEAVVALADRLGLSRDQLSCELRLLEQRGIISSAPWDRLESAEDETVTTPGDESATTDQITDTPLPEAADPPPTEPTFVDGTIAPPEIQATPPTRPGTKARDRSARPRTNSDHFRKFAEKRIGTRRRLSPRRRRRLLAQAAKLGLSQEEAQAILVSLSNQQTSGAPPVAAPTSKSLPKKKDPESTPSESFRRWVKQKLVGYPSAVLGNDDEKGLIGVGVHRYRLASVLATHIVRDIATDREIRLERDLDGASCHSTVGTSAQASEDDVKLREFFDQVAPILTQHRGINARSRVMMNAIAEQLGLSQDELERAITALQQTRGGPDENDPRQMERRESFRQYLRRAVAQLPNGIVTFQTERRLAEAGEHFHGVAPQWIKPTINEVATEMGARFISEEQAREHVATLVDGFLAQSFVVDGATRGRIYAEGTQWGLDPVDIEAILRERTELKRQHVAAERQRTRWILRLSGAGVTIAVVILLWMVIPWPAFELPGTSEDPNASTKKAAATKPRRGTDWWNDDLQIAVVNVRATRPDLKASIEKLRSPLVSVRTTAYRQLVELFMETLGDREQQDDMRKLCVRLFAQDPSDSAARQLPESLLSIPLALDKELPKEAEDIDAAFWGCRTTASMLKYPELAVERAAQLATKLESAIHQAPDRLLGEKQLQQQCLAALAQRFYEALTRWAKEDPELVATLFAVLSDEAATYLDRTTRDRLNVQFLAAILPVVGEEWDEFGDVIRQTARADDASVVIQLLQIFQDAEEGRLHRYLGGLFLDRIGAASGELTKEEMIEELRKSLGVASKETDNRRWIELSRESKEILNRKRVDNTNPDVLLQEMIDLAHLATLTCALSQGDAGNEAYDELKTEGPGKLDIAAGPWSTKPSSPFTAAYPLSSATLIQQYVANLKKARATSKRLQLLQMISNQAAGTPDIEPSAGTDLAEYLMKFKTDQIEHRRILVHAPTLAKWNSVRLGLADQLATTKRRDSQLLELLRAILGSAVDLNNDEGVAKVQRILLTNVVSELSEAPETDDARMRVFDQGSEALVKEYNRQAKLLNVPPDKYASAEHPSDVMIALIGHLVELLGVTKLNAADRKQLEETPYRLKAADYISESDLQYTALLQRIWVRLLALHVSQARPDHAVAARNIAARLDTPQPPNQRVFEQLRDLQASLLELWLLRRPEIVDIELESTAL